MGKVKETWQEINDLEESIKTVLSLMSNGAVIDQHGELYDNDKIHHTVDYSIIHLLINHQILYHHNSNEHVQICSNYNKYSIEATKNIYKIASDYVLETFK